MRNDTIYLRNATVYDTFSYVDTLDCGLVEEKTEIILSSDSIPEHISQIEAIGSMLLSGGQNRFPFPQKLYYKRRRLFEVNEDGTLRRKRIKNFTSNKRYKTNYFKV